MKNRIRRRSRDEQRERTVRVERLERGHYEKHRNQQQRQPSARALEARTTTGVALEEYSPGARQRVP